MERGKESIRYPEALKFYKEIADRVPMAEFKIGYFYEKGYGVPKDKKMAKEWYKKSGEKGYPDANEAIQNLDKQSD